MSGLERHNPARDLDGDFPDRELVEDPLQNLCDAVGVQVEAVEGGDRHLVFLLHPCGELF